MDETRLIWVQTVCKGYQQKTKVIASRQLRVNHFPSLKNNRINQDKKTERKKNEVPVS